MRKHASHNATFVNSDLPVAIVCTVAVAVLYCLRLGFVQGNILNALFLSMFVVPTALGITFFVELPVVFLMRMWKRTRLHEYILVPGLTVLLLHMASVLSTVDTFSVLKAHGRDLFLDGHIVWRNIGWMAVDMEYVEPALWASLAGLMFWMICVRNKIY